MTARPFQTPNCTRTAFPYAIKIFGTLSIFGALSDCVRVYHSRMSKTPPGPIRSEARGPHWVAWIADANGKPVHSVVLVGKTQKEAEGRAKIWAEINAPG